MASKLRTPDQATSLISGDDTGRSCVIADPGVQGRNCRLLQGPMAAPQTVAVIREAIENTEPATGTILRYRKDGSRIWNHLSIRPTFDGDSSVRSSVAVQSLTDRKK